MSQIVQGDFFISYTHADSRWTEWIAWQLEEAGYSVILQAWDFRPGANFVSEMEQAISHVKRTIAVLSPQYLNALYTQPEWAAAFRRDPKGEQGILVPVRVEECEVTGLLGQTHWFTQTMSLPQGQERWVVVRTEQGEARAQATLKRQVEKAEHSWKQKLWHLSKRHFACEADAQSALTCEVKGLPVWLEVQSELVSSEHHAGKGRPRKDADPTMQWHIQATVSVKQPQVEQEARRKACFIVTTNVFDSAILSDQELVTTYKEQGSFERGYRFLKDPLFLASSVFVKKPERIVALGLIMVLCLLVYRLAEHRLRTRLAETEQTLPDQLNRPTARPTMRWVFQCFVGIELLHVRSASGTQSLVLRLQPIHRLVLALLGPPFEKIYQISS